MLLLLAGVWALATSFALASPPPETAKLSKAATASADQERIGRQLRRQAEALAPRVRSSTGGAVLSLRDPDGAELPTTLDHPSVHTRLRPGGAATVGWSAGATTPRFSDRRRRPPRSQSKSAFGHRLDTGVRFVYDVFVAGSPAGTAEAWVGETTSDPRGDPPAGRPVTMILARASTGGVVALLGTLTDEMESVVDAETGAPVRNTNLILQSGLMSPYKRRETVAHYEGRGRLRIVDSRDGKTRRLTRRVPEDTLDAMGAMAWVRSLQLAPGERAQAHAIDGSRLLRLDVIHRGQRRLEPMPTIATALGIEQKDLAVLEGMLTGVDRHDVPIPDRPVASFRFWMTTDERRIIVAVESDIWLTAIRLELSRYQPPRSTPSGNVSVGPRRPAPTQTGAQPGGP